MVFLALIAFFINNLWFVLTISILMAIGAVSIRYNSFYQFHFQVLRKLLNEKSEPLKKESGELSFACGTEATFLFVNIAWILVSITAFLMLLAGISGICVVSIMYVLLEKIFRIK